MLRRARGAWWCVFKATSCRLWRDRYNLQGADFGASQYTIGFEHSCKNITAGEFSFVHLQRNTHVNCEIIVRELRSLEKLLLRSYYFSQRYVPKLLVI
jgi:hypothetical protein